MLLIEINKYPDHDNTEDIDIFMGAWICVNV